MTQHISAVGLLLALTMSVVASSGLSGCAGAAVAAAGAAGGIAYTDRGAKSDVKGSVSDVSRRAASTFEALGIRTTEEQSKDGGKERERVGKTGDKSVSIQMKDAGNGTTHVEVVAREGAIKWTKDYARDVLSNVIGQG